MKFTYKEYKRLINTAINKGYRPGRFSSDLPPYPTIFLRHDSDMSPRSALELAKIEVDLDVFSTFFFMDRSPMYDIEDPFVVRCMEEIASMGHDVGRHLTVSQLDRTETELSLYSRAFTTPVFSIHKPTERMLGNSMSPVNTYNKAYFNECIYIADSSGRFRMQQPYDEMDVSKNKYMQLSTHPCWWSDTTRSTNIGNIIEDRILEIRRFANSMMGG